MREERQAPDKTSPVTVWKEDDMIDGQRVRAMVVILRTKGCWWAKKGGCTMCGYNVESLDDLTSDDLRSQISKAALKYEGERMVKVYTSGSFLDENEMPSDVRDVLFETFAKADKVLFESRPEFITEEMLAKLPKGRCVVALGLETESDDVRSKCIRKGFRRADIEKAAENLKAAGIPIRTYLILKPPFLTEKQAMDDTIRSIAFASSFSDSISINPLNVQSGTVVEDMWRRGDLRPPWLWSLVETLREGKRLTSVRVMSAPSGGATARGAHNCGKCDRKVLDAVERFSFSQNLDDLEGLDCECRVRWRAEVDLQGVMRTTVDMSRHIEDEPEL
ncbi:MAG: archaeosine biosynthesis radical SAM protein RaSEA [Euryarchaeota archaeon]|nr:archaeosine biosynthesis radical SAM protein RaSEA [Euryarchaeota archaeon]